MTDPFLVLPPLKNLVVLERGFLDQKHFHLESEENLSSLPRRLYESSLYWIEKFEELAGEQPKEIKLELQDSQGCRLFHRDHVGQRMVVTYYGPTTEWIENEYVQESGLTWSAALEKKEKEKENDYIDRRNSLIVKDWSKVRSAPFQGALFMHGIKIRRDAVVHRSPAKPFKKRVVLILTS